MSQFSRWTWRPLAAADSTTAAGGAARRLRWRGKRATRPCDVRAQLDARMLEPRRLLDAGLAGAAVQALSADYVQVASSFTEEVGAASASETAANTPPSNLVALPNRVSEEGGEVWLRLAFADPDPNDRHQVQVLWGDGSSDTYSVEPGNRYFSAPHRYVDDDPSGSSADAYTITMSVVDQAGGRVTGTTTTTVRNVAPHNLQVAPLAPLSEGDVATLQLSFDDPGLTDVHSVEVAWGDGSFETFVLETGARQLTATHVYVDDDPSGTPVDDYLVFFLVKDDDGGAMAGTTVATVSNAAPHNITLSSLGDVQEGELATLEIAFDDPGLADEHVVEIAWGDGKYETFALAPGARTLTATHVYVDDDPSGTPFDDYLVFVRISDDDGGQASRATVARVRNVAPHDMQIAPLEPTVEGDVVRLAATFADPGLADRHTYQINWGDGTTSTGAVVGRDLFAEHVYADDGLYTVTLIVRDDDVGAGFATTRVAVANVDPELTGADAPFTIDEGQLITLRDLGVGLRDPGFDNPLNTLDPSNGGETSETFTGYTIDWGDGTAPVALDIVDRVNGGPATPTVAQFSHAAHAYADDGRYVATLTLADDDGAPVSRQVVFNVVNVAPTLTLTPTLYRVDEGTLLELPDLGAFSDPGFDNPLNPLPGGEVAETFVYSIDWGDGTPVETGLLPATRVSGGPGVPTTGSLARSHFYADNDRDGVRDNLYTVTVALADDDGGVTVQTFLVGVWNTDPVLEPISATDVDARGTTTLTLEFADRGADSFEVLVDWGDRLSEPDLDARFVVETAYAGPTPQTFVLTHKYAGPPDPLNPAADIEIRVKVRDDDFGFAGMQSPGESNLQRVAISNPGIGTTPVRIDTTPQVPRLTFPVRSEPLTLVAAPTFAKEAIDSGGEGGASGETQSASERYLEIRIVYPDGTQSAGFRVNNQALQDLPGLFRDLPDNRYAIYLVQPETGLRRLVVEAYVRQGRLVDSSEEADDQGERLPGEGAAVGPGASGPAVAPATVEEAAEDAVEGADEDVDVLPAPASGSAPDAAAAAPAAASGGAALSDSPPGPSGLGRTTGWHWAAWALVGTAAERRAAAERALAASTPEDWQRWRRRRRPPTTHQAG
jgi:hypothetical protein